MATLQAARQVEVITPLGDDVLLFHSMTATEELGRLFQFELELLSNEPDLNFDDLLGQNVTVRLELPDDKTRYFNGFVSRFSQEGTYEDFNAYSITVHPWLWFLTRCADCRIFQQKTVPDIIKEVFGDHGFTDYEESLSGTYRTWDYCVQYRETDFNFVSRLMEQEGIYYYFKHEIDKHTLVLSDSVSSHEPFPDCEKLPYYPPGEDQFRERDHIYDWNISQEVQPGVYALNDFDFKRPKSNLQVKSSIKRDYAYAMMEVYDYPGEYIETGDGETYARARIEELQVENEQVQGQGNARGLCVGSLFELTDYLREDQNREYLIVSATHQVESDAYSSGSGGSAEEPYSCSFTALPSKQPFRPARSTPKPIVQGPQTAVVVGPKGEEIYTDEYGRVKVKFFWDRYSSADENSSCWIRVSQIWAGSKWGGVSIPRIGQEVVVEFLEGDPDRPLITGRVYNNDNMPPYELPANGTQTGIKSRSSKEGNPDNFNEIRIEDKKGEEQIFIQAEKNQDIRVKNDCFEWIGNNRHLIVKTDQKEQVENNRHEKIGADHLEEIGKDRHLKVKGKEAKGVDGSYSFAVKGDVIEVFKASHSEQVTSDYYLKASNIVIEAMTNVTIKVGQSYIAIEAGGIKIGTMGSLQLESTGPLKGKGTAGVKIESPAMTEVEGTMTTVKASGVLTVQGALVKIN
jgi:type VI secretion system secreted protein VgrG